MTSDERFRKVDHLAKTKDFRRVYRVGTFFKIDGLVFYYLANTLKKNRIGFSAPSKNIRLAARRNHLKRLLREVYRKRKKYLKNGYDMVLVIKKDLDKAASCKDVEDIFLKLTKKAGLLA